MGLSGRRPFLKGDRITADMMNEIAYQSTIGDLQFGQYRSVSFKPAIIEDAASAQAANPTLRIARLAPGQLIGSQLVTTAQDEDLGGINVYNPSELTLNTGSIGKQIAAFFRTDPSPEHWALVNFDLTMLKNFKVEPTGHVALCDNEVEPAWYEFEPLVGAVLTSTGLEFSASCHTFEITTLDCDA